MVRYCERCKLICEGERCPGCGAAHLAQPEPESLCFLIEREAIWAGMIEDVLRQSGIPFLSKGALGAGMALKIGPGFERFRFYVPYARLARAQEEMEGLFSQDGGGSE